jgi:hypothetical protein
MVYFGYPPTRTKPSAPGWTFYRSGQKLRIEEPFQVRIGVATGLLVVGSFRTFGARDLKGIAGPAIAQRRPSDPSCRLHRCRPACHAAHGTPRRRQGGQARKPILLAAFAILRFAMCALHALRRPLLAGRCVTPRRRRQRHPRGHVNSLWIDGTSWSDWTSSKRPCVGRIPRYRRRDDRDRERVLTDRTSRVACDERTVVLISASSAGVVRRIALSDH